MEYMHIYRDIYQGALQIKSFEAYDPDSEAASTPHKPLILSFHGPKGTGKSLPTNMVAWAL